MSWRADTDPWPYRVGVMVDGSGSTAATNDVDFVIPADFDLFWDNIDASGNELRACASDGFTLLTYSIDNGSGGAFSKASRLGRVQVDGLVKTAANCTIVFWLYFGLSGASSGAASTTISGALTGRAVLACPPPDRTLLMAPETVGTTEPSAQIQKAVNDAFWVWLDVEAYLSRRCESYAGSLRYAEIGEVSAGLDITEKNAGSASIHSLANTRIVFSSGRTYVLIWIGSGGSSGVDYTIKVPILLADKTEAFELRALLKIQNVEDA